MADKGIIFSAPMVRALLAGRKTQTRRLLRNPEYYGCPTGDCPHDRQAECDAAMASLTAKEAGYAVGDRLYVREAAWIAPAGWTDSPINPMGPERREVAYVADDQSGRTAEAASDYKLRQRPSIHMPRWASRLWLSVTEVRVEQLQAISEKDCIAEGIYFEEIGFTAGHIGIAGCNQEWSATPQMAYANLWRKLHTQTGTTWADNPWVVAVSFTVNCGNIDGSPA
ncbi:MAG: hypothetical protein ACOY7T_12285 [Pseudomonadota bacterium]